MGKYGIPPKVMGGFNKIISLQKEEIHTLVSILNETQPGEGIKIITEKFSQSTTSLDERSAAEIIRSLFSMVQIFVDSKDTINKFTEDFTKSFQDELESENFKPLNEEELVNFKKNISILIPCFKTLKQGIKARDLISENPNNFSEARIISDVRIVYDDDDELQKIEQLALVVHNLKLNYFDDNGKPFSFFISLNLSDLHLLNKVISRAIEKDNQIRSKSHELNFIDIK